MKIVDRALRVMGLQRADRAERPRVRASTFAGGGSGRLLDDFYPSNFSPDYEVRGAARLLRARARQLVRDNAWAAGFARELANNVVGPKGIILQAKVTLADGETLAKATNRELERQFAAWGMPETASADGFDSWLDQQRLMIQTVAVDGECFVRRLRGFDNAFGYALQFLDADLVDEFYNVPRGPNQNEIRMGVEIDAFSRPVAYHVWNHYQYDRPGVERKRDRIPASEILHLFVRYRPNQLRGVTWFAPVMPDFHHLARYVSSEVIANRVSAAKMGWIVNKSEAAVSAFDPDKYGEPRSFDVEEGLITELLPGQEFQSFDPTRPSTTIEQFVKTMMRAVAKGLGPSYFTLTGDTKEANFSSQRLAMVPERDWYRGLQTWLSVKAHRVVYRDWVGMALLSGALAVDSRLASNYLEVRWKGRGWAPIQPLEDAQAFEIWRKNGIKSRQGATSEFGDDYEDIVDELAYEEEYADEQGVDVSGEKPTGAMKAQPAPEPSTPDDAEDASTPDARAPRLEVA